MKNKKIMPPTFFVVFLALSLVFHFIFPMFKLTSPPCNYFGFVLIIFGIWINLWTDSFFKKNQTTVKPHGKPIFFIDYGPFRLSRNPMYLGMLSILLGNAVLLGSLFPFIFSITFAVIIRITFIPTEEKNLEEKFGDRYVDYKKKVRRWI